MEKTKVVRVGSIGVDSGLCWIGDPCYLFNDKRPEECGKDWVEFCDILRKKEEAAGGHPTRVQYNYDKGHAGLGVLVSTGYGDGVYPVMAEIVETADGDRRIRKVWVEFIKAEDAQGING